MRMTVKAEQLLQDGSAPECVYHDRTAWRCTVFVGKRYGSKGYPQKNAAHVSNAYHFKHFHLFGPLKQHLLGNAFLTMTPLKGQCARGSDSNHKNFTLQVSKDL